MSRRRHATGNQAGPIADTRRSEAVRPQLGDRIQFHCGACEHSADATYKLDRDGFPGWMIGSHTDRCPGRGACLRAVADWLNAPSAAVFKRDPRPWLAPVAEILARRVGEPEPLPSLSMIQGWQSRLISNHELCNHLTQVRGLTRETIDRYQLGYGDSYWRGCPLALKFPVFTDDGDALIGLKERFWPELWRIGGEDRKSRTLGGRQSLLYPDLPRGGVLLVAGELDALAARQHGASYVVTATCGASLPNHLVPALAERPVAVAYDVGEEDAAERTVAKLRAARSNAWVVRLERLGLGPGGDLNDYFSNGGTARELATLIRRENPRS